MPKQKQNQQQERYCYTCFGDPASSSPKNDVSHHNDKHYFNNNNNNKKEKIADIKKQAVVATTTKKRKGKRVLVIDDEKDIADVFKMGLELKGFEVYTFTDPFEALSNFKADYYDIIISDIRMPEINGFELCKQLVKIDDKVKIFFVSAFETHKNCLKEQYPNLIIDEKHFVRKPISIDKLAGMISSQEEE